jgi:hypothetical protein
MKTLAPVFWGNYKQSKLPTIVIIRKSMNHQSLFIISSIFFLFLSCQKEIKKNNPDGKTVKTIIDSSIYIKKKYPIAAPPPPPPPKLKTKEEIQIETVKQKLKINRELKKQKESVSNIIVENLNSPKPTFTTDNGKEFHQRLLDHYAALLHESYVAFG